MQIYKSVVHLTNVNEMQTTGWEINVPILKEKKLSEGLPIVPWKISRER